MKNYAITTFTLILSFHREELLHWTFPFAKHGKNTRSSTLQTQSIPNDTYFSFLLQLLDPTLYSRNRIDPFLHVYKAGELD